MPDIGRSPFRIAETDGRILFITALKLLGTGGILMFVLGMGGGYLLLTGSILSIFLGVTDFGRRCPLILSARHILNRLRLKHTSKESQ